MGYSISWFAVPETHADSFFQKLSLVRTGETEEYPNSMISSARLDTGWRMLWYDKTVCPFLEDETLSQLSHHHDIIACTVEEHCMDSTATLWQSGLRTWSIHHNGNDGPKELGIAGTLPGCFDSIRSELERKQTEDGGMDAEVDHLFDIPLAVARHIVGFKHDEESPYILDGVFHVLARGSAIANPSLLKRGFIARLFQPLPKRPPDNKA